MLKETENVIDKFMNHAFYATIPTTTVATLQKYCFQFLLGRL